MTASSFSQNPEPDAAALIASIPNTHPRLILREGDIASILDQMETNEMMAAYAGLIVETADGILDVPPLVYQKEGRRLLGVSRKALKRFTFLAMAWRLTGDSRYLDRLETGLQAVCSFVDWNPSHFLDTAEMSMAIALAVDWCYPDLPQDLIQTCKTALIEKGLTPGLGEHGWVNGDNNWNQVCHAGMVAAAFTVAEEEPQMAATVLGRARTGLPFALEAYSPDGAYVEGATYWSYGTSFSLLLNEILETSIGTDFDFPGYPGFMESARYVSLMRTPSGALYNYADCGDRLGFNVPLLWFARETGNPDYLQRVQFDELLASGISPESSSQRILPIGLIWLSQASVGPAIKLPLNWQGRGQNPVAVFRSAAHDPRALYLGCKGGQGTSNHGNMDAGSFILELDGVRWSIDTGNQDYNTLETLFAGKGSLWDSAQDGLRWTLISKNNFGHSTLTVNDELFYNEGFAEMMDFDGVSDQPTVSFDLSEPLKGLVSSARRKFTVLDHRAVRIEDRVELAEETQTVTWAMMTQAEVETFSGGAILRQDGERLRLRIESPATAQVGVVSMNPPPRSYDKRIEGLKRVVIVLPAYLASDGVLEIAVTLEGMDGEG